MLEELIAHHCAPALAGIKPANIASCRRDAVPDVYDEIKRLNRELNRSDIYFEIICDCEKCVLIMAYRKSILKKHLETAANQKFLLQYGYPISGGRAGNAFARRPRGRGVSARNRRVSRLSPARYIRLYQSPR